MDQNLESQIISIIEKDVEKFGAGSIKQAAHKVFYNDITLSEQKAIAKLIVKTYPFVTETKGGEIIVKKNSLYTGDKGDTNEDYQTLKYIMYVIVGVLSYLIFKLFLPNLTK